jgi:hypothetical protein
MTEWVLDKDFAVGDRVEARDGSFRGIITAIVENAEKWPYTVRDISGKEELFASGEIRKVDPFIRDASVTDAVIAINAMIKSKQAELSALLVARNVLEQEAGEGTRG